MRIPKVKPRRGFMARDSYLKGRGKPHYREGDGDFIENNMAAAVWFLENRDKIVAALKAAKSR